MLNGWSTSGRLRERLATESKSWCTMLEKFIRVTITCTCRVSVAVRDESSQLNTIVSCIKD